MNTIVNLYKIHINPNPDGYELHSLFSNFDLGIFVNYPDCEPFKKLHYENNRHRVAKINACKEWILKNSKL